VGSLTYLRACLGPNAFDSNKKNACATHRHKLPRSKFRIHDQRRLIGLISTNDAIAGFTNQSLGLPAYACTTGSSTSIKLAPRIHQKCKKKLWGGHSPIPDPSRDL